MRLSAFLGALPLIAAALAATAHADESAVKTMIGDYANAFNAKDLDKVMGYWSERGVHIDRETGERTEGRDAIRTDITEAFEQRPGSRILGALNDCDSSSRTLPVFKVG